MDVTLGEWLPDRGFINNPGVVRATNLVPAMDGYLSIPALKRETLGAIDARCRGSARGVTSGGEAYNVAGTEDDLWLDQGSDFQEVSKSTGIYSLSQFRKWFFTQYGEWVFATYGAAVQEFHFGASPSSTFLDLDADASHAHVNAVFNDFLILGDIVGQGVNAAAIETQEAGIHWSEQGDPTNWPRVGTAAAADALSDYHVFEGDGGKVNDIVPTAEFAIVLRERQVWRMDFIGSPAIFAFRKLDNVRGGIVPGSGIAVGGLVFFQSEQGFMVTNGAEVKPFGHEKVDRYWRSLVDFQWGAFTSVAHDADTPFLAWTIPVDSGNPTKIICYQYEIKRWFLIEATVEWIQTTYFGVNLGDMDSAPYATMDMDVDLPTGLADQIMDALGGVATEALSAFVDSGGGDHEIYSFTGTGVMPGDVETGDYVRDDEARVFVGHIRPLNMGSNVDITVGASFRNNVDDGVVYDIYAPVNIYGVVPIRRAGRFVRVRILTTGTLSQLQGFQVPVKTLGRR